MPVIIPGAKTRNIPSKMTRKNELEILVLFFFLIEEFYAQAISATRFPEPFCSSCNSTILAGQNIKEKEQNTPLFPPTIQHRNPHAYNLNVGVVRDGSDRLGEVLGGLDDVGVTGLDGLSLQVQVNTLLLSLALLDGVLLDTVDELLTGAGVGDVLDTDVEALLEVAVADTLVDDNTDGGLGHVVDDASLAVVVLVGKTAAIQYSFFSFLLRSNIPKKLCRRGTVTNPF
jgi:hypothetical protein